MTALFGFSGDGFVDASPPNNWSCTSNGGSSYIYDYDSRGWYGREDDGNGYSYLYLPLSLPAISTLRLSFQYAGAEQVSFGADNAAYGIAHGGQVQFDFQPTNKNARIFIRTDSTKGVTLSGIILEVLS